MLNYFNILANEMTNEEKINNNIEKNKDKLIIDINISEDSNKKVLGRKKKEKIILNRIILNFQMIILEEKLKEF